MQQPDGEHAAEILLVQPFDNVRHLKMTVPDALLEHRGNAVAAVQQAFLVVALDGDISQPFSRDAQICRIDRPEQPLLRAAVLNEKTERLLHIVIGAERNDGQVSEPQHLSCLDEVCRVHRILVGGGRALAHVYRHASFQHLCSGFRVILMLMADKAGGNVHHAIAEPLLQLPERQTAFQQQGRFPVRHNVGVAAGAARQ